jgi:hypothetical protein
MFGQPVAGSRRRQGIGQGANFGFEFQVRLRHGMSPLLVKYRKDT